MRRVGIIVVQGASLTSADSTLTSEANGIDKVQAGAGARAGAGAGADIVLS